MTLGTARKCLLAACVLMLLSLFLFSLTKVFFFVYLGIALAVVGIAIWFIFGRCRSCGRFLKRAEGEHCPHCGEKLEW